MIQAITLSKNKYEYLIDYILEKSKAPVQPWKTRWEAELHFIAASLYIDIKSILAL